MPSHITNKLAPIARSILTFCLPGGLIFAAAAVLAFTDIYASYIKPVVGFIPAIILFLGVMLGWRFNRSRLIMPLVAIFLAGWGLDNYAGRVSVAGGIVRDAITLLLPLNLLAFSLMKERGILTPRGLLRLGAIALQAVLVWWLSSRGAQGLARYLDQQLIDARWLIGIRLSQPAMLAFLLAAVVTVVRHAFNRCALTGGFFWAVITCLYAVSHFDPGPAASFYLAVAGLILIFSVIESSHSMAFKDELTGLPGRRALNEELLKLGRCYSIAMVDIDFFKKFNDRYGHDVGDQVLKMVASRLARVGGGGRAFRYGGEEFTIVFPGREKDEVLPYLEELRGVIETSRFTIRRRPRPLRKPASARRTRRTRQTVAVTVSMGLAQRSEKNTQTRAVIKSADKALYRAKKTGRNRVCG